jgi:hypothetical protein
MLDDFIIVTPTIVTADHVIDGTNAEDYDGIDDDDNDNDSLALSSVGRSDDENDDNDDDDDNAHLDEVNDQHDTRVDDFAYSDELPDDNLLEEPDFLFYNDSDATHDITSDNVVHNQGFSLPTRAIQFVTLLIMIVWNVYLDMFYLTRLLSA